MRLRGANHVANYQRGDQDYWGGLWAYWDWDNWVRPQLDDISRVGNAVRFWGNTYAIGDGSVSLGQYLDRWQQVLDYAKSVDIYVYPCGGDLRHWGSCSLAQSTKIYGELAQLCANYSNVVGFDITNEVKGALMLPPDRLVYHEPEPPLELLETLSDSVRASGLPITHSRDLHDANGWAATYFTDGLGDFLDFHVYYKPDQEDSLQAYAQSWGIGKKLMIGEFGQSQAESTGDRAQYYESVRAMSSSDSRCVGAFAWSAWDQAPSANEQYGLFDSDRLLRQDIGAVFREFPTAAS